MQLVFCLRLVCVRGNGVCQPVQTAQDVVSKVVQELGHVDILVNNASEQHMAESLTDITPEQLRATFATNVYSYFYFAQVRTGLSSDCS